MFCLLYGKNFKIRSIKKTKLYNKRKQASYLNVTTEKGVVAAITEVVITDHKVSLRVGSFKNFVYSVELHKLCVAINRSLAQ